MPLRRRWILHAGLLAGLPRWAAAGTTQPGTPAVHWPADAGAHPDTRIEWWYLTGFINSTGSAAPYGFQLTFFRRHLDSTQNMRSALAARQLLFADAAISDVSAQRLWHAQRMARWSGAAPGSNPLDQASASRTATDVRLGNWQLISLADTLHANVQDDTLQLALRCRPTQAVFLQGDHGRSRKGPAPQQFSYYYSQPQLAVEGTLQLPSGRITAGPGSMAWLDHEWSDELLPQNAVGWDWVGINLLDGSALMAFQMRANDGSVLWTGGALRRGTAHAAVQIFSPEQVRFEPLRHWRSTTSTTNYPVTWRIHTPAGSHTVEAAFDAQEVDSRASTGALYWEGLCTLRNTDAQQALVGRGYLEMTGYANPLHT